MKYATICLLALAVGYAESAANDPQAGKPEESKSPTPQIVSLVNAHSAKRFLEAEFDIEMIESTGGYEFYNESLTVSISSLGVKLKQIQVMFKPISEENVEKAILFARKILVAAGEDAREVESKIDEGRAGYFLESPAVTVRFAQGTLAQFATAHNARHKMAAVTIKLENPETPDHWKTTVEWFRSKWWSLPVLVMFVLIPIVVQWMQMIKALFGWVGRTD